ncbi:MAG TPA: hypothetical protein ENJ01_02570 [Gammaproteobacteria bacterium]|nr:hypothetical protein [Gammaproteobacteria bacterium]
MSARAWQAALGGLLVLLSIDSQAARSEWSGNLSLEYRDFLHAPLDPRQHGDNLSAAFEPKWIYESDDRRQSLVFVPFVREDQGDAERSHADIRELIWEQVGDDWELRLGIGKVFWGVTESQHLVDIINQTDLVENFDREDKLGQPMINLSLIRDWGTVDVFILPGFRERTFPGVEGRFRALLPVAVNEARYESADEDRHIDYALRWSHSIGDWDLGLSWFRGTGRDPDFIIAGNRLIPFYPQIEQYSLDAQATLENWLWKLEVIHRSGQGPAYWAATGGFEYTFYDVVGTGLDVGALVEYLFDERGTAATTPFNRDVLAGVRLAFNDEQSSEILFGIIQDLDNDGQVINLEASRRLGEQFKLELEARWFRDTRPGSLVDALRVDDYLQAVLSYYF